jgi:hypothetical protein
MDWGLVIPLSVVALAIGSLAYTVNNWIRARHGYPLVDGAGGVTHKTDLDASRKIELLTNENGQLKGQVSRLEERIAVLERIATDPAERTAREIEKLR